VNTDPGRRSIITLRILRNRHQSHHHRRPSGRHLYTKVSALLRLPSPRTHRLTEAFLVLFLIVIMDRVCNECAAYQASSYTKRRSASHHPHPGTALLWSATTVATKSTKPTAAMLLRVASITLLLRVASVALLWRVIPLLSSISSLGSGRAIAAITRLLAVAGLLTVALLLAVRGR